MPITTECALFSGSLAWRRTVCTTSLPSTPTRRPDLGHDLAFHGGAFEDQTGDGHRHQDQGREREERVVRQRRGKLHRPIGPILAREFLQRRHAAGVGDRCLLLALVCGFRMHQADVSRSHAAGWVPGLSAHVSARRRR